MKKINFKILILVLVAIFFFIGCTDNDKRDVNSEGKGKVLLLCRNMANELNKEVNSEQKKDMSDLCKKVEEVQIYDTGYAFLLDEEYNFIVHPTFKNKENLGEVGNGLFSGVDEFINENNEAVVMYRMGENHTIVSFVKLSNGYILGITTYLEEAIN